MKNSINPISRLEGLCLIIIGLYIFNLFISDRYHLLLNPKFAPLTLLFANCLWIVGGYLLVLPSRHSPGPWRLLVFLAFLLILALTPLVPLTPGQLIHSPF